MTPHEFDVLVSQATAHNHGYEHEYSAARAERAWFSVLWEEEVTYNGHTFKCAEQKGGVDQGYHYHVVIEHISPDGETRWFQRNGHHQSHDGTYLDGPTFEVFPEQVVVTKFNRK